MTKAPTITFASASFTSRNLSSLSIDRLNSRIYMICRASLIETSSDRLPQKRFTKKDAHFFLTGIVTSISRAFSASSSLLKILENSFCRYSVLMLLSLSSVTNLSLLFGFRAACILSYRFLRMERWAAVTVVAILSQPALLT